MRTALLLIVACLLSACSEDNADDQATEAESPPPEVAAGIEDPRDRPDDAEVLPDNPLDARRQELSEAMAEDRGETADPDRARERRQRLRQNREAVRHWWNDSALIAELELDEDQLAVLERAGDRRRQQRVDARQQLAEAQSRLQTALGEGQDERAEALIEQRRHARETLDQAEDDWLRTIVSTLDEQQLELLAERRPEALHGESRPRSRD